jgi:hypothetical protein
MQAGWAPPDYGFSGRGSRDRRTKYLSCVKAGYRKDYSALAGLLREALERRRERSV